MLYNLSSRGICIPGLDGIWDETIRWEVTSSLHILYYFRESINILFLGS